MTGIAEKCWRNYAFYNREMVKFINQQDIDIFLELSKELAAAQEQVAALTEDDFSVTPEGQQLVSEVTANTRYLKMAVQRWLNTSSKQQTVQRSYDSLGQEQTGNRLNWHG